jgi:hypothetical protein
MDLTEIGRGGCGLDLFGSGEALVNMAMNLRVP